MTPVTWHDAEVCIAGGGPAGLVLALELARRGRRVVVVEQTRQPNRSFRGETISPDSVWLLDRLGVLDRIRARMPLLETRGFEIRDGGEPVLSVDFRRFPFRYRLPVELPQPVLLQALAEAAAEYPTFTLLRGTAVTGLSEEAGRVTGVLARGPDGPVRVRAALTVGADGRFSRVREMAGLPARTAPMDRDVLWFMLPFPSCWEPGVARVRIAGDQHALFIPTYPDLVRVGLNVPKGRLRQARSDGLPALHARVDALAPELAGTVRATVDSWAGVVLLDIFTTVVPRWSRPGFVLVGDAAHTLSPILGQGVNHAVADAVLLAPLVAAALAGPEPAARLDAATRRFQQVRDPSVRGTRRLQLRQERAFGYARRPAVDARRAAYRLVDRTDWLKRQIWNRAYYPLQLAAHRRDRPAAARHL